MSGCESGAEANSCVDVCFVMSPVLSKGIPAFEVSILKACLTEAGFMMRYLLG